MASWAEAGMVRKLGFSWASSWKGGSLIVNRRKESRDCWGLPLTGHLRGNLNDQYELCIRVWPVEAGWANENFNASGGVQ